MSVVPFHPRGVTEIVDAAFQVLRRHYAQFVLAMAVAYVPWLAVVTVLRRTTGLDLSGRTPNTGFFLVMGLGSLLWYALMNAALVLIASDTYTGRPVDIGASFRHAARRFPAALAAVLLKALAAAVGMLAFLVGALYVLTRFFAVPAVVVLEDRGPLAALGRSSELSAGEKWRIFRTLALAWVIYMMFSTGLGFVALLLRSDVLTQVLGALFTILVYPLLPVIETLLYYDARIRKEGYDIELMARDLGGELAGQAAG
jgi:hypothetical protein